MELGPRQEQLVAAWESGEYDQNHECVLRTRDDRYCCLGVACNEYNPDLWEGEGKVTGSHTIGIHYIDELGAMPETVQEYYGFYHPMGAVFDLNGQIALSYNAMERQLSVLNDDDVSFKHIAEIVRNAPEEYFKESK